jgi:hypothetical protein
VLAIVVFWIKQQVDQDWDEDAGIALVHWTTMYTRCYLQCNIPILRFAELACICCWSVADSNAGQHKKQFGASTSQVHPTPIYTHLYHTHLELQLHTNTNSLQVQVSGAYHLLLAITGVFPDAVNVKDCLCMPCQLGCHHLIVADIGHRCEAACGRSHSQTWSS